jgi:glycosyltransferase involved in cell wall biosynthesis
VQGLWERDHSVRVLFRLQGRLWITDDLQSFAPVTVPTLDQGLPRLFERGVRRLQSQLRLPYIALFESRRFARACREQLADCDLLFERMSWFDYGGALAARRLRIPLILENNGDHLTDLHAKGLAPRGAQRRLSVALTAWAVRRAAHIVVSGEGWRQLFLQRWDISPQDVTTVENGTILTRLLSQEQLSGFQQESQDRTPEIVYLGSFQPWQGVPVLLRAFARARDAGLDARLTLIGSGAGVDDARAMVHNLSLHEIVSFTGRLLPEEYAPLLAAADIGVAPYCNWPEFSGLKLFDYKAAGLAVIASGRDGHPPTLSHNETGLIVPPCDEEALAQALLDVAGDGARRRRLGRAARLEAEKIHGWSHTIRQLEQIFERVLDHAQGMRRDRTGVRRPTLMEPERRASFND